jgi:predicted nucleic acid-binding protein
VNAVAKDPDDNVIIETAMEAGAACIVSGDQHLLELAHCGRIRVVSPAPFVEECRLG